MPLARSDIIEALIQSGIGHYIEFKKSDLAGVMLPTYDSSEQYPFAGISQNPCAKGMA